MSLKKSEHPFGTAILSAVFLGCSIGVIALPTVVFHEGFHQKIATQQIYCEGKNSALEITNGQLIDVTNITKEHQLDLVNRRTDLKVYMNQNCPSKLPIIIQDLTM